MKFLGYALGLLCFFIHSEEKTLEQIEFELIGMNYNPSAIGLSYFYENEYKLLNSIPTFVQQRYDKCNRILVKKALRCIKANPILLFKLQQYNPEIAVNELLFLLTTAYRDVIATKNDESSIRLLKEASEALEEAIEEFLYAILEFAIDFFNFSVRKDPVTGSVAAGDGARRMKNSYKEFQKAVETNKQEKLRIQVEN